MITDRDCDLPLSTRRSTLNGVRRRARCPSVVDHATDDRTGEPIGAVRSARAQTVAGVGSPTTNRLQSEAFQAGRSVSGERR